MITTQMRTDVSQLYVALFGRAPDGEGLGYWVQQLDAGQSMTQIADTMYATTPARAYFPSFMTNGEIIASFYVNVLGRTADAEGLAFWTAKLNASGATPGSVITEMVNVVANYTGTDPAGLESAALYNNKVSVAQWYGEQNGAIAGATTILTGVTADPATVTAVKSGSVASGQTFTLTAGADTIVGTSGNDKITALTIDASGAAATTLSAFDAIDGGAGTDTLNIYSDGTNNTTLPTSATVKNVETINIYNDTAAFSSAGLDASKFVGATSINQNGVIANVINLAATTTAGFIGVLDNDVTPADDAASVSLDVTGAEENAWVNVEASTTGTLNTINVKGTMIDGTDAGTDISAMDMHVTVGKDVETLTINSAANLYFHSISNGAGTKVISSIVASSSTGDIEINAGLTDVANISTGAGKDDVTVVTATLKDDALTTTVETVSATVATGAGNDQLTINTTGTGTTTADAGDGDDTVTLTADGSGKLTVALGAGDDTFNGAGAVSGTDAIDAGAGTDTLLLNMVGAANIGAFSNFETFDAAALAKTLDVEILAAKNTVTEFVASADVGAAATLSNIGAGVNFRATGDMTTNALTLTQKTAGALTVTLDADSTSTTAQNDTNLKAIASNATSLKAVFAADSAYEQNGVNLNDQTIDLTGSMATALEVVSGGTEATNTVTYTTAANTTGVDKLATAVISGASDLTFDVVYSGAAKESLTSVDASAMTGALVFSTADLKASTVGTFDGGVVKLGSGADIITGVTGANVSGFAKGTAENASVQGTFDVLNVGTIAQAADVAATSTLTIKDGLFTFNGTGPATLTDAIAAVDTQLTIDDTAVVFEYVGNSYVFVNNDTTADSVVKLVGLTGLVGLDDVGGAGGNLYVF